MASRSTASNSPTARATANTADSALTSQGEFGRVALLTGVFTRPSTGLALRESSCGYLAEGLSARSSQQSKAPEGDTGCGEQEAEAQTRGDGPPSRHVCREFNVGVRAAAVPYSFELRLEGQTLKAVVNGRIGRLDRY